MELEKAEQVVQEISEVCKKHGVYLVGTCEDEGMYSEIRIFSLQEPSVWINPTEQATNEVRPSIDDDGTFKVTGIQ